MSRKRQGSNCIPYLALLLLVAMAGRCQPIGRPQLNFEKQPSNGHRNGSISYVNAQYGFRFDLPDDWERFSVVRKQWTGDSKDSGPLFLIRNPSYTDEDPHEDIPIMVFTRKQWKRVAREELIVSAAPFPPSEIARNTSYVLALPPRFDYDDLPGVDEVHAILRGRPMHTFRPKTQNAKESR